MQAKLALIMMVFMLLPLTSHADACTGAGTVTLGCSIGCDASFRAAIRRSAKKLHVEVSFVNLYRSYLQHSKSMYGVLDGVDAILSPGGKDINPKFYRDAVPGDKYNKVQADYERLGHRDEFGEQRDPFEHALYQTYFSDNRFQSMPALGVCYGMQMMAVANHVPLVTDIKEKFGIPNRYGREERIFVDPKSSFGEVVPGVELSGHEEHHQAVDIDAFNHAYHPGVHIAATSNDGKIPEVMTFDSRPAFGTQFHPELSEAGVGDAIFSWLLVKACQNKRLRESRDVSDGSAPFKGLAGAFAPLSPSDKVPCPPEP